MQDFSSEQSYYLQHSANTDPGKFSYLIDSLENDVCKLFLAARHVVEHHAGLNAHRISSQRLSEMDTYRVEDLLKRLAENGVANLKEDCPLEKKNIGNCVTIAKMACAMLRHKGIPARMRYAYCTYFQPDFYHEQVLVDYWVESVGRWRRGDASMNYPILRARKIDVDIDFFDVEESLSKPIAAVWQACRKNEEKFELYGHHKRGGVRHVAQTMLHDLACLNHVEMMPWDFGTASTVFWRSRKIDMQAFDALAEKMMEAPWSDLLYASKRLPFFAVPRRVLRRSPYSGNSVTYVKGGIWRTK